MKEKIRWQMVPMVVLLLVFVGWLILEVGGILSLEEVIRRLSRTEKIAAATIIVLLLASDVVIPVPSTILMTVAGSIFGLFWGIIVTAVGSMSASITGYWIGKMGGRPLAQKVISQKELDSMERWSTAYGKWPVVLAKTLPMMAETVAVSAGIAQMPFISFSLFTLLGTAITCSLYVMAGENASSVEEVLMIVTAGFVIAVLAATIIRHQLRRTQ